MATPRFLYGGGSNMKTVLLQNQRLPCYPSFLGSGSTISFEGVNGGKRSERSFFGSIDEEEIGDEALEEYYHQPDKKRRLKADQVQFLEKSFEAENKLEPERKIQLAKDLGLQPRQVAIWFQNRRARWKTKQLERDYDVLQASFNSLKADYDNLLKEKDKLKSEVIHLTDKLLLKENEKEKENSELSGRVADPISDGEVSKDSTAGKKEDFSSAKSDVYDSDSPRYADVAHSSPLELGDSPYVHEPDQSDVSQDEEDNFSRDLYLKIEDADYLDSPANSGYFGFPFDDHPFGFWS